MKIKKAIFYFLLILTFVSPGVSYSEEEMSSEEVAEDSAAEDSDDESTEEESAEANDAEFEDFNEEESTTAKEEEKKSLDEPEESVDEQEDGDVAEEEESENLEPLNEEGVKEEAKIELIEEKPIAPTPSPESSEKTFVADDSVDENYEAKLHDIYIQFHKSRTSDADWSNVVGGRATERYNIVVGDSLWNISKTLFGDGNYWPKVWSLNNTIANPHLISPNNNIRFVLGDESQPPAFTVTENTSENPPGTTGLDTTVAENATPPTEPTITDAEPDIPPPLKPVKPVVRNIPPSLPEWQSAGGANVKYDALGIDYGVRKISQVEDSVALPGYISENAPEGVGRVAEIEVGHQMASAYQYIYVSMKKGQGDIGSTYLVIHNRGRVEKVHATIKGTLGYAIDIQGEVQLIEKVSSDDDDHEEYESYRALVLDIVNPVTTSGILVEGKIEKVKITEEGPRSQVVAQIVGGVFFNRRQVYSTESFAFLNKGESDGIKEGQILPIRATRVVRDAESKIRTNIRPVGWLRVVKTTPKFATSVIVRAWSEILTGDVTGAGDAIASVGSAAVDTSDDSDSALNDQLDDESDNSDEDGDSDVDSEDNADTELE